MGDFTCEGVVKCSLSGANRELWLKLRRLFDNVFHYLLRTDILGFPFHWSVMQSRDSISDEFRQCPLVTQCQALRIRRHYNVFGFLVIFLQAVGGESILSNFQTRKHCTINTCWRMSASFFDFVPSSGCKGIMYCEGRLGMGNRLKEPSRC